jgi:hypothetical protein
MSKVRKSTYNMGAGSGGNKGAFLNVQILITCAFPFNYKIQVSYCVTFFYFMKSIPTDTLIQRIKMFQKAYLQTSETDTNYKIINLRKLFTLAIPIEVLLRTAMHLCL